MTANSLQYDLEHALAKMPIFDVYSHLNGVKLAAGGLHEILLLHMLVSDLYGAGCPSGARLTDYPNWPSQAEAHQRIEEALPCPPHISTDIGYRPVREADMEAVMARWPQAGLAERSLYASYVHKAILTTLETHAPEIVFQFSLGAEPLAVIVTAPVPGFVLELIFQVRAHTSLLLPGKSRLRERPSRHPRDAAPWSRLWPGALGYHCGETGPDQEHTAGRPINRIGHNV